MKKYILSTLILLFSVSTFAAVPYAFQSGTPAVAAHVNANFDYLDERITTLANHTRAQSASISYTPITVVPGTQVIIDTTTYHLFKVPVYNVVDNILYHVSVLSDKSLADFTLDASRFDDVNLSDKDLDRSEVIDIAGHTAYVYHNCAFSINNTQQVVSCYSALYVELGALVIPFEFIQGSMQSESEVTQFTDYDYTDEGTNAIYNQMNMDSHINQFIDYIKIEEVAL